MDRGFMRRWVRHFRGSPVEVELKVHLAYDDDAQVWYVASSDIPGLHLEADDAADLVRRIEDCAPEMIRLNLEEIVRDRQPQRDAIKVRPIFDSPFSLGTPAHAC